MKRFFLLTSVLLLSSILTSVAQRTDFDWLLNPEKSKAFVQLSDDGNELTIGNAMVSRTFRLTPNLATISMVNRMNDEQMVRAVSPEGSVTIDKEVYSIGGLEGQPERAYLRHEWLDGMTSIKNSFQLAGYTEGNIEENIHWARKRWALNKDVATGKTVTFHLEGTGTAKGITLDLTFSVYDRIPTIGKTFELCNKSGRTICLDSFMLEHLAVVEPESLGDSASCALPNMYVESDYNCGGDFFHKLTDITTHWALDPEYTSQRSYANKTPCMLNVHPKIGPSQILHADETFHSFTVYEMPFDSYDRERQGLFQRRYYRTIAPWTTENPIFMHLTSSQPEAVRTAIDQCAETGYEMVIISFSSGLNAEDVSDANIAKYKSLADYAHSKGIELGCYSLLASRRISDEMDCVDPVTGKTGHAHFGNSPCLGSQWGLEYFANLEKFLFETGMDCLEHDGSYPGDVCASTSHPGHRSLEDSQWTQFTKIAQFYRKLCEKGIYLNVPDLYFLNGSTKVGIGYKEVNWSLPRDRQIIHTRQLNHDCTYERPQSACWSFVPLSQYHGGGAAATIEPLHEHLQVYKDLMFQNYSAGVQACYRGPRLYDTDETKDAVTEIISWYKKYRDILNSDIIHLRKPDARDWDGMLHVNPMLKVKGLAVFYNPTSSEMKRTIHLPLYYTGLTTVAKVRQEEGTIKNYRLDREYCIDLPVTIPANGHTWFVIE